MNNQFSPVLVEIFYENRGSPHFRIKFLQEWGFSILHKWGHAKKFAYPKSPHLCKIEIRFSVQKRRLISVDALYQIISLFYGIGNENM